jgi:hypothetical protein
MRWVCARYLVGVIFQQDMAVDVVGYEPVSSRNREFSENFRPKRSYGGPSAGGHWKFACDPNQLHNHPSTFLLLRKTGV